MSQNYKMLLVSVLGITALWIYTLLPGNGFAAHDSAAPDKVLVGVVDAPPFSMKTTTGR